MVQMAGFSGFDPGNMEGGMDPCSLRKLEAQVAGLMTLDIGKDPINPWSQLVTLSPD